MNHNKPESGQEDLKIISTLFLGLILLYSVFAFDWEDLDHIGSFIGGVGGTLLTIISIYFIYKTYMSQKDMIEMQRQELQSQKEELKDNKEHIKKQQFEATLFKMLDMIHTIGKGIETHGGYQGHMFYRVFRDDLSSIYKGLYTEIHKKPDVIERFKKQREFFYRISNDKIFAEVKEADINPDEVAAYIEKNREKSIGIIYWWAFKESDHQLGHYFRYIYHTIKFILKERTQYKDEKEYIELIQSQLSNLQLTIMMYSCLSSLSWSSGKPKLKQFLDYYDFFQNVPQGMLIDVLQDHEFYPCTGFKFLPPEEIKRRRESIDEVYPIKPTLSD